MGVYDQACRYCAKMDPRGFFQWLLPQDDRLVFSQWLDTRTIPFPGEPDRICDSVGGFASQDSELLLAGLVVEFQSEPEGDVLERLLEYAVRVRRELRHVADGRSYKLQVSAALVNLTGGAQPDTWTMQPAGFAGAGHTFRVVLRIMSTEDWNMRESQQVLEWQREARQEGWQKGRLDMLLQLLQVQFGSTLPESLVAEIRSMEDEQTVSRWLEAALRSPTLEDFRTRVNGRN
jgi:hypothetical protein